MAEPRTLAGRYRLDEPLGEQPVRLLAHDQKTGRTVVVTRVETGAEGTASEEIAGRAGRSAADVTHRLAGVDAATVVAPTEALLDRGELWVVRPDVDAELLTEHQLDERGIARVGADVAGALAAAHGAGVVHGDVRADSILVRADGSGALVGFATTAPRDVAPAVEPANPEPDRVAGRPAGPASDVYALGVVLAAALERAGTTPTEPMAAALRTMRAGFADVRPTAWAVQQRLTAVATSAPPARAAALADPTRATPDAGTPAGARAPTGTVATGAAVPAPTPGGQPSWPAAPPNPFPPPGSSPAGRWSPPGAAPLPGHARGGGIPGGHPRPGPADRRPSSAKGWIAAAVAVLATIGIIAGLVAITEPVTSVAGTAAAPPGTKPPPPSLLGEVRTADPCSLIDPSALGGIGTPQVLSAFGDVAACSVGVNRPSDYGFVTATIYAETLAPPSGVSAKTGELTIHRTAEYQRTCSRTIVLPDGYRVEVYAGTATGDTTFPVCELADTATDNAASIIGAGEVGHRDPDVPRNSLLSVRACDLIDQAAIGSVPSLRNLRERGYNDWSCQYGADPAFPSGARLYVTFTRYSDLDGGGGVFTLDGRSAATFPSASGQSSCEVAVAQRSFTAPAGNQRLEVLSIRLSLASDQPGAGPAAACAKATDLARTATPRMPPTR